MYSLDDKLLLALANRLMISYYIWALAQYFQDEEDAGVAHEAMIARSAHDPL